MSDSIDRSVILPAFNEAEGLTSTVDRVVASLSSESQTWEIVIVDDGSSDRTWNVVETCCRQDTRIRGVRFARNFGHQIAVYAGIQRARGAVVAVLDSDGQDPPELLPEMFKVQAQGYDVVNGVRRKRKESLWKRAAYYTFYRIYSRAVPFQAPLDSGDFSVFSRNIAKIIAGAPRHNPFVRGIRGWVGGNQTEIEYERDERTSGSTKYSITKLFFLALTGIAAFSKLPLRMSIITGTFISLMSLLYGLSVILMKLIYGYPQGYPGWASLAFLVAFLGGIHLVVLGVIGEYVGYIYDAVSGMPPYVVMSELNLEDNPAS